MLFSFNGKDDISLFLALKPVDVDDCVAEAPLLRDNCAVLACQVMNDEVLR